MSDPESVLAGHHAVVTGAGRGIGAAIAERLTAMGAVMTLLGRNQARLEATAGRLTKARGLVCDVTDEEAVGRAFTQATEDDGPPTILINNAGVALSMSFAKTTREQFHRMLDCLLYTSPSPRDGLLSRMPSSA